MNQKRSRKNKKSKRINKKNRKRSKRSKKNKKFIALIQELILKRYMNNIRINLYLRIHLLIDQKI